jgi:hypothetical protein
VNVESVSGLELVVEILLSSYKDNYNTTYRQITTTKVDDPLGVVLRKSNKVADVNRFIRSQLSSQEI